MGNKRDDFGNRMKAYEEVETGRRFLPLLPIYARIDGKCFSKFTKGLRRPYDERMVEAMVETTKALVEKTQAKIGYTQSDEINLVWYAENPKTQIFFDGRIQKMTSVLAAMATSEFYKACRPWSGLWEKVKKESPVFDCRVFQLPTLGEAANMFLWREKDATKNAVSMAARKYYRPEELHEKSANAMQMMLLAYKVNFNDYPAFFKRGTFVRKVIEARLMSEEELARIPPKHRPCVPVYRSRVEVMDMPIFTKVLNREGVIFRGEDPITLDMDAAGGFEPPLPESRSGVLPLDDAAI